MDYLECIEKALEYIEENLEDINVLDLYKAIGVSGSHFQHIFSITCNITLGEYIRKRKFTRAALDLLINKESVTSVAYKYGYHPDSFTKVFKKIHGFLPSKIEKSFQINVFNRLYIKNIIEGEIMNYKIVENKSFELLGYKKRFNCEMEQQAKKVEKMWLDSRNKQNMLLKYRKKDDIRWIEVNTSFTKDGFDHYITVETNEKASEFEKIIIPNKTYAVFETERCSYPTEIYMSLRKQIFSKWTGNKEWMIEDGLEIVIDYWYPNNKNNRYIEIWLPLKRINSR